MPMQFEVPVEAVSGVAKGHEVEVTFRTESSPDSLDTSLEKVRVLSPAS
jgi:hypothetical protein